MRSEYGTIVNSPEEPSPDGTGKDGAGRKLAESAGSKPHLTDDGLRKQHSNDSEHLLLNSDTRSVMSERSAQAGVKRLEAISSTWTKRDLYVAYLGIALLAYATSLGGQTTNNLTIYATSAFKAHSLVSTVLVVQGVVLSVAKPPMSKIADVWGRFESFCLAVLLYTIGHIQQAASNSVNSYAAAQIFYSAGATGLQILIQIFIADTSDLLNRALCSTIPDLPFLVNVWIGPALAERILKNLSWRWGYGIWAVVLPVAFLPLALALVINQRKAAMRGILPKVSFEGESWWAMAKSVAIELDFFGLLLLSVAFTLILLPLTLAAKAGWRNPNILAMLLVGVVCLVAFPFWERSKTLAPRAFFARSFWRNKTLLAGVALSFFYFMAFYLSVYPYFQSYLLVVQDLSVTEAGRIVQTFTFTSTITAVIISLLIKYTRRYKTFMIVGTCVYIAGLALMIRYRTQESSTGVIIFTQVLLGIGGSLTHVPAQLGVQASVTHTEVGAATALFLTFLEIGGAVGAAISGAIWTSNVPVKLAEYLPPETRDQAAEIYGNISLASSGWAMGTPTRIAINRAYQETMTKILTVAVFVAVPCVVLSLMMEDHRLDEINQGVKGLVIGGAQEAVGHTEGEAGPSSTPLLRASFSREDDDDAEMGVESWRSR